MRHLLLFTSSLLLFTSATAVPAYRNPKLSAEARADDLLARMTLEEKVGETMLRRHHGKPERSFGVIEKGEVGAFLKANGVATIRALQEHRMKHSRLGIPLAFHEDVIHGCRTIAPIPLATACSWDEELIECAESLIAKEAAATGLNLGYAPMVDVCDDPRWGRVMETNGEDPLLSGRLAAARVRGFQGGKPEDLARPDTIMACAKHYLGYASLMGGLDYYYRDFSERDILETYLVPYEYCVKAGVGSVMCTYTGYNGVPGCMNRHLNRELLRSRLGFKGLLMTDYDTIGHARAQGVTADMDTAVERTIGAGIDMDMVSTHYGRLVRLVKEGKVDEKLVDEAARRCLVAKFQLGLFDDPYRYCDATRETNEVLSATLRRAMTRLAEESMVLLKNEKGALPIAATNVVALVGWTADSRGNQLGRWSLCGRADETVTMADAMSKTWGENFRGEPRGYTCNIRALSEIARDADAVVVALGENSAWSGEARARATLETSRDQIDHLKAARRLGKKTVAVVFAGRPIIMKEILENADAVLYAWFPGTMGGGAIANLLSGKVTPSGKTVQTFPAHVGQLPMTYRRRRPFAYTGYGDLSREPQFPFGFGLSYNTYEYSDFKTDKAKYAPGEPVVVTGKVTNRGAYNGREIVQLYVRAAYTSVMPRERELRDFASVRLKPGETKTVRFVLDREDFSFYDENLRRTLEPGEYTIFVGEDSTTQRALKIEIAKSAN